jgi:primosomal protein N'
MSIPDYQTPFQTLWLFQKIHEKTTDYFCIQTKDTNSSLLTALKNHTFETFLDEDMQLRKEYGYPPYTVLVTITFEKIKRKDHLQAKEYLKKSISQYEYSIQSHFFEFGQYYEMNAKIHITLADWKNLETPNHQQFINFLQSIRDHADISIETSLE